MGYFYLFTTSTLLFIYLYHVPVFFMPNWVTLSFMPIGGLLVLAFPFGRKLYHHSAIAWLLLLGGIPLSWMLFSCIRSNVMDGVLYAYILGFFGSFLSCGLVLFFWKKTIHYFNFNFINLLFYIIFIQSLFILVMPFYPTLRYTVYGFMGNVPLDPDAFRCGGLTSTRVFGLGVLQSLGAMLAPFVLIQTKSWLVSCFVIFSTLSIVCSTIISARIGILGVALGTCFFCFSFFRIHFVGVFFLFGYLKRLALRGILLIIFCVIIGGFWVTNETLQEIENKILPWAFSIYFNYQDSGKLEDETVNIIMQKFYWMPPWKTFIFGDGLYMDPYEGYYMHTDAGYMRSLLFFGVIGSFFVYIIYIFIAYVVLKKATEYHLPFFSQIIIGLTVCWFFYHWKGDLLISGYRIPILFLFLSLNARLFTFGSGFSTVPNHCIDLFKSR